MAIKITVTDEEALELVKTVYANKLNATSRGARYAMNSRKRKFMQAFRAAGQVEGEVVPSDCVLAVYNFCLPRCDLDAPIKAVQDAAEEWLACRNDRVIKSSCSFITRPAKGTSVVRARKPSIEVSFFCMKTEAEKAMEVIECLLTHCSQCWR
tara:strand:- start:174 stop:632 length:459 start_codon:yes stop_codon:yes gene_type:complete